MDQAVTQKKIEIIAEIANTHQGDMDYAISLAKKCILAGANAVKFQIIFSHLITHLKLRFVLFYLFLA